MEPRYKLLAVALVPVPRQVPLPPFAAEDLQRVFADVTHSYPYQSFEFIFNNRGAKFSNGEADFVELRPARFQIQAVMDGPDVLTAELAQKKVVRIFKTAADRLKVPGFVQCSIQVVAGGEVSGPDPDAKAFVAEQLMAGTDRANDLGTGYFGGGVRFRRIADNGAGEDTLSVEPFLHDNSQIYLNHQLTRVFHDEPLTDLDSVGSLIDDAFEFLSAPVMRLLSS